MFLVELVMQGVRGFQQLARLRFQGGFNIVVAGNERGKTTAVDSVIRLLFPQNDPARLESFLSQAKPDASRGALVVFTDDQSYYQIIQDFSKRAVNLSRHDPATKKFVLQNKDWDAASQFMGRLLPNISEEDYARLFVFRRESCSGPGAAASAPAAVLSASRPSPASIPQSAADQGKLVQLKETLRKAEEAADAEYKADAARIRLGETVQKLERINESRGQIADLEAKLEELKVCETFPPNLADMISMHETDQSQKMVKTDELDKDIEGLTMQRDSIPASSLLTEKLFIAGAAIFVLVIVAGLFLLSGDQALFFPLGVLGAVSLIGSGVYNSYRKNAQRKEVQKEIDELVKERAEVEKKFQDSGATILKFMKAAGVDSAGELKEKADTYRHFLSLIDDSRHQQNVILGGRTEEELLADQEKQQEEVAKLEQEAAALAKYAVDTYSVRQEIDRLEAEMSPTGPSLGFGETGFGAEFAPAASGGGAGLNVMADIAVASRMSGIEMETLVPAAESAAQRNLASASAGRYVRVEVGPDGFPLVHDNAGGKHPFASLSHSTRELVCLCLRTGLVEAIAGKRRLPFVLDDPFAGLDPARQAAACQALRVLGTKTQVILFTSNPALRAPTDVAAELK